MPPRQQSTLTDPVGIAQAGGAVARLFTLLPLLVARGDLGVSPAPTPHKKWLLKVLELF